MVCKMSEVVVMAYCGAFRHLTETFREVRLPPGFELGTSRVRHAYHYTVRLVASRRTALGSLSFLKKAKLWCNMMGSDVCVCRNLADVAHAVCRGQFQYIWKSGSRVKRSHLPRTPPIAGEESRMRASFCSSEDRRL
jgi:hypothetical protein